ncbi:hypothetical protein J3R30DRAFT_3710751 [Lentinula aciculospora]|uniref:Uncharacterized protein n=1 Tax=Lentinula aciculospora TaxID=153920 RepID=A0A9W9A066_9AGAR|nr:hypothetical protein J3R30DRAFT_3710751 [Lentinula aciculospora]
MSEVPAAYNIPQPYKAIFAPALPTFRIRLAQQLPYETTLIKTAILHQMLSSKPEDAAARINSLINALMDESEVPKDPNDEYLRYLIKRSKKKIDREKQKVDKGKAIFKRWVEEDQGIRDSTIWEDLLKVVNLTLKSDDFGDILFGEITPELCEKAPWLPTKSSQILPTALALPKQWKDIEKGEEPGKRWVVQYILGPLNEALEHVWNNLGLGPSHPRPPLVPVLTRSQRIFLALHNQPNS